MKNTKLKEFVILTFFTAIIILMAFTPFIGYIPLVFTKATTIHIPVIIGSIILGPKKGGFLGFVFGLTSFINNSFVSPTVTSFVFTPIYTLGNFDTNWLSLVICFVPRILVGVVPYYVYKFLHKKSETLSLLLAGVIGSLTNTLLVMNMIYLFFGESYAAAKEASFEGFYYAILTVIGTNGVPEAIVAAILVCAITKALKKADNSL